jgi:hypothetical protein
LDVVDVSMAAIKLQEQLLARERELDSREGAITMWEFGSAAFACALGEVCMECDAKHIQVDAVQWDFLARTHTSSSCSIQLHHLSWMSNEYQILLCL